MDTTQRAVLAPVIAIREIKNKHRTTASYLVRKYYEKQIRMLNIDLFDDFIKTW